jgi:hypothetical protein
MCGKGRGEDKSLLISHKNQFILISLPDFHDLKDALKIQIIFDGKRN